MDKEIDCVGLMCPVPVVKAKIAYKTLKAGDSIVIYTDHSCTFSNMKDVFKKYSCDLMEEEEDTGIWKITITKQS